MFGRDAEVAAIEALVRAARGGRSGALIVSGEPGIGKTAVLARAREAAGDALVLEATGSEAESHLAFAGLADLVGPVLGHIDEIPGPQAVALRGALALGPPQPGDRFTAYAATLSLLAAAAERRPVVCIVDDAQWLDAESFEAIQFAGRRLGAEGVALLIGVREGANPVTDASALPRLRLTGLDDGAAARLLVVHAAVAPAADVQRALVGGAAGNPLALIELASGLDEAQLTGRSPLPDPLPVGRHLSRALLRPLDDLPESTRRALLVASAGDGSAAYLGEALRADGRSFADLEPAERAGVVGVGPSRVLFSHPLVRAAVYQAAPAPDRRSAHAAHAVAAERVNETGALGRRAWHLALASAGPDEAAAAELERAARDAVGRNGHAAATGGPRGRRAAEPRRHRPGCPAARRGGLRRRFRRVLTRSDPPRPGHRAGGRALAGPGGRGAEGVRRDARGLGTTGDRADGRRRGPPRGGRAGRCGVAPGSGEHARAASGATRVRRWP